MNNSNFLTEKFSKEATKYPKKLYDKELPKLAGLDRGQGIGTNYDPALLKDYMAFIKEMDIKQHNRRFEWYNLPDDIDGDLIERLLYFRGQLVGFYYKPLNKFYILPYALNGTIDAYGRYNTVRPVMIGTGKDEGDGKEVYLDADLKLNVIKDVLSEDEDDKLDLEKALNSGVILRDHTPHLYSQTTIPRNSTVDKLIKNEAEQLIWSRTASMNSVGTVGIRCDANTSNEVIKLNGQLYTASLSGDKFIPVKTLLGSGAKDADPIDSVPALKPQEFLQSYQSLDNYRLMTLGLENGGVFEKQGTILQSEANLNSNNTRGILLDDLRLRQKFCIIMNQVFGLSIWCDLADEMDAHEAPNDATGRDNMLDNQTEQLSTADDANAGGVANV